jgi:hypothetical protein
MPTKWVVTTPSDHIELDEAHQAETTFTVTNPTAKVDRVVFDVAASEGTDTSWFSVEQPQRRVPPSGSVSYLLKTSIPADAKAGIYSVQGRAYSADSAPEEDSVLSSRLVIEIKPKAAPVAKKRKLPPWWIWVVAGLVVIVVLVIVFVFAFGGTKEVTAPDVTNEPLNQAKTNLSVFGLTPGLIHYQQTITNPGEVIAQSVIGGTKVDQSKPVDLVLSVSLVAPTPVKPNSGATVAPSTLVAPTTSIPSKPSDFTALASPSPEPSAGTITTGLLNWTDKDPFVTHWQVTIAQQICVSSTSPAPHCAYVNSTVVRTDQPSYTPIANAAIAPTQLSIIAPGLPFTFGVNMTPGTTYEWTVAAVDDFGTAGPASPVSTYVVQ